MVPGKDDLVLTAEGVLGRIVKVNVVGGVRYFSLAMYARMSFGFVPTGQRRFVSQSEIQMLETTTASATDGVATPAA